MGLIPDILRILLGGDGRTNTVVETIGAFRENADRAAEREAMARAAALEQFAAEFGLARRGRFDRLVDGLNRLPRPTLAFGTIGLFVAAMWSPSWFAARMQGVALIPEPLWWLMGAVVSFYFGARYQAKAQDERARILKALALGARLFPPEGAAAAGLRATGASAEEQALLDPNPALDEIAERAAR